MQPVLVQVGFSTLFWVLGGPGGLSTVQLLPGR